MGEMGVIIFPQPGSSSQGSQGEKLPLFFKSPFSLNKPLPFQRFHHIYLGRPIIFLGGFKGWSPPLRVT